MLPRTRYLISLLGLGLASTTAFGQGLDLVPEIKLRLANTLSTSSSKDHLYPWAWGIGIGVTKNVAKGKLGVELGYHYKGGDPYLTTPTGAAAGMNAPDVKRSYDERGNQAAGIALRVSYSRPIENTSYSWQAGLMFGGSTAKFSYEGDVASEGWYDNPLVHANPSDPTSPMVPTRNPRLWRDTYSGSKAEWYKGISPFAGFSTNITEDSFLELNVMVYNYKTIDRVHVNGSAPEYEYVRDQSHFFVSKWLPGPLCKTHNDFPQDRFTTATRWVPHLELNYGFRF